jgi:hypothetical protein
MYIAGVSGDGRSMVPNLVADILSSHGLLMAQEHARRVMIEGHLSVVYNWSCPLEVFERLIS